MIVFCISVCMFVCCIAVYFRQFTYRQPSTVVYIKFPEPVSQKVLDSSVSDGRLPQTNSADLNRKYNDCSFQNIHKIHPIKISGHIQNRMMVCNLLLILLFLKNNYCSFSSAIAIVKICPTID